MTQPLAPRPLQLRRGLRRLSSGLIAYGIVGLVVAAIGFAALFWVNGRIGSVRTEADATIRQLATTTERTADALHDASRTAKSFSVTLDQASTAMPAASAQIATLRGDLTALEGQLRSVNIFGATPLAAAADAVAGITKSMEGLDTQLSLIGVALGANGDALGSNATSLGLLGDSTAALAVRLRSGVIEDSLGDVQMVVIVLLLVFTVLSVVPALGALALGVWLKRELAGSNPTGDAPPPFSATRA
jgi:hypothetical protein